MVKDFYFLKWGMGNCVEKLNRLTTTVRDQKYFDTMIGADNVKDNKNRLCSRIGSGADHPKKRKLAITDFLSHFLNPLSHL